MTVVLIMIYMGCFILLFFNHAVITMGFIVSTMTFYHAIFGFSCQVCSFFQVFLTMQCVVKWLFCIFGSFFLHGRYYAFTWGRFFQWSISPCKTTQKNECFKKRGTTIFLTFSFFHFFHFFFIFFFHFFTMLSQTTFYHAA